MDEDGLEPTALLEQGISYTYDDCIFLPGHISFGVGDVQLQGRIARHTLLKSPLISSPMDTVTETSMALAMAKLGGIGVVHFNLDAKTQTQMVHSVKAQRIDPAHCNTGALPFSMPSASTPSREVCILRCSA